MHCKIATVCLNLKCEQELDINGSVLFWNFFSFFDLNTFINIDVFYSSSLFLNLGKD